MDRGGPRVPNGLEEGEETVMQQLQLRGRRDERRTLYTDAAWKGGEVGVAVVQGGSGKIIVQRRLPVWAAGDPTVAELIAIEAALAHQARRRPLPKTTIIATDSKRAIRHIAEGANSHGQYVVRYIRKHIAALRNQEGGSVVLQWTPAHKGIDGNERADELARKCLTIVANPPKPLNPPDHNLSRSKIFSQRYAEPSNKMALRVTRISLQTQLDKIWKVARTAKPYDTQHTGAYTWQLDGALPGPHIATVYNALSTEEASILAQCRTGHSRLRSNLYRMRLADTASCECGAARETIEHVIYECPLLQEDAKSLSMQWGIGGGTFLTYSGNGTLRKTRGLDNQSTGQRKNGKQTFRQ
jgi:ribonuclease HI